MSTALTPAERASLRFGTSSFSEKAWVGPFYPPGTKPEAFLRLYAERYDTVEIDSTYYGIPSVKTVQGWAEKTPPSFRFAAKFPAAIVHAGDGPHPDVHTLLLPDKTYATRDRFLSIIGHLKERLGPLLLQFPYFSKGDFASSEPFLRRLDHFLSDLPHSYQYAVEIRNRTWLTPDFADLCRRHGVALVLVDYLSMPLPDRIEVQFDPITADYSYVRLIGNRKQIEALTQTWDREVIDRQANLEIWADFLRRTARRRVTTYIYINNHYAGHAPATLRRLSQLVFEETDEIR